MGLIVSRHVLTNIIAELHRLDDDQAKAIAQFTLEKLQARSVSFEDQVSEIIVELYSACSALVLSNLLLAET